VIETHQGWPTAPNLSHIKGEKSRKSTVSSNLMEIH